MTSHILLVNDDGIHAPGLKALFDALRTYFKVTVVAPNKEFSGSGGLIDCEKNLEVQRIDWGGDEEVFSLNVAPFDCAKLGLYHLKKLPDLIVTGINPGANYGQIVMNSGTVCSASVGPLYSIPSIAFSATNFPSSFSPFSSHILPIVNFILEHGEKRPITWNVTFPDNISPIFDPKKMKIAKQGSTFLVPNYKKGQRLEDLNNSYFSYGISEHIDDEMSDVILSRQGYTTLCPLHFKEATCKETLSAFQKKLETDLF